MSNLKISNTAKSKSNYFVKIGLNEINKLESLISRTEILFSIISENIIALRDYNIDDFTNNQLMKMDLISSLIRVHL
jgi:hypothetical protein